MRGIEKSGKENGKSRTERHEGEGRDIRQRKTDARETPKRVKRSTEERRERPQRTVLRKMTPKGGGMERKTQYRKKNP